MLLTAEPFLQLSMELAMGYIYLRAQRYRFVSTPAVGFPALLPMWHLTRLVYVWGGSVVRD